jgi:hypothetical protein
LPAFDPRRGKWKKRRCAVGGILGVLLGAVLLVLFRKLLKFLIPLAFALGCIGALAVGWLIEGQGGQDPRIVAVAAAVSALLVIMNGIPLMMFTITMTTDRKVGSVESRVQKVEEFLVKTTGED